MIDVNAKELKPYTLVSEAWSRIYEAKMLLGEEHPLYRSISDLGTEINTVVCQFHPYVCLEQEAKEKPIQEPSLLQGRNH